MNNWLNKFTRIDYASDGEGDYFDDMMGELTVLDQDTRKSPLSSTWARGRHKSEDPDKVVLDLMQIQATVHSLMRVHGIPRDTRVGLACLGQLGRGAAGFEDVGHWKRPFIVLDKEIYENCDAQDVLDVYCGVALHEASHLNHSRKSLERMAHGELTGNRRIWEGLLEDERIESKVRAESPGFSGYLYAAKRALFEKKEFGSALTQWTRPTEYDDDGNVTKPPIVDMDRITVLIFAFIRCPHLLTDAMKQWTTLKGRCPFSELRSLIPTSPKTEDEVEVYGKLLLDWYDSHRDDYQNLKQQSTSDIADDLQQDGDVETSSDGSSEGSKPQPESEDTSKSDNVGGEDGANGKSEDGSSEPTEGNNSDGSKSSDSQGDSSDSSDDDAKSQDSDSAVSAESSGDGDGTEADGESVQSIGQSSGGAPGGTDGQQSRERLERDVKERLAAQVAADKDDADDKTSRDDLEKLIDEYAGALNDYEDAKTTGQSQGSKHLDNRLNKFEQRKDRLEKKLTKKLDERLAQGRFGLKDLAEMLRRIETVSKPLDKDESEAAARADELRVELGPEWKPDANTVAQKCIIVHPTVTPAAMKKYNAYLESVRPEIARMRNVFRFRLGEHTIKNSELREGRLDRRRLGRAMQTDRLFYTKRTKKDRGIAIGLLIDESGSMAVAGRTPPRQGQPASKAQRALQVAILLSEALQGVPGVELEVYSFTTCGDGGENTYFKYLYGKNNPNKIGIADYGRGQANYDYQAIACAVEQMKKFTTEESKLLIVVSDGAPCGALRSGMDARRATKGAVDLARKQGFEVLQIAIEDHLRSADMYGKNKVIEFTDMSRLIADMRKFVSRIIRSATT